MKQTEFVPEIAWSLLNTPDTADVTVNNAANGNMVIITGLPAFDHADLVSYTSQVSVLEVPQVARIIMQNAPIAATRYGFKFGATSTQEFGYMGTLKTVASSTPLTITGTAATDRHNLYVSLAWKVMQDKRRFLKAYPLVTFTHATDGGTGFTAGLTITGGTSGATGIVKTRTSATVSQVWLTSLNPYKIFGFTGTTAISETFSDGTNTIGSAASSLVLGVSLDLVDYGGYYNPKETKTGATEIQLAGGFVVGDLTVATAAVKQEGNGTWLAGRVPVPERTSGNLASGAWNMALNNAPDSVTPGYYTKYNLRIRRRTPGQASMVNQQQTTEYSLVVWAKESSQGTAPSNFNTAIAAL